MSPWLRIDDKFVRHHKIAQLTDREFRVHMRVLCYCAEYATGGVVHDVVFAEVPGLTYKMGEKFVAMGLWDATAGTITVHDFDLYNPKDPTAVTRAQRYRDAKRDANRDGHRDADRDATVTDTVTETVPHVRAPARGPSRPLPVDTAEQSLSVVRAAALPNESLEELGQRVEAAQHGPVCGCVTCANEDWTSIALGDGARAPYGSVDSVYEVIDKPAGNTRRELEKWLAQLEPHQVEHVREQVLACEPRKSKAAYAVGTAQRLARAKGAA